MKDHLGGAKISYRSVVGWLDAAISEDDGSDGALVSVGCAFGSFE